MGEDADVANTTNLGFGSDGIVILGHGGCAEPSGKAGTGAAVGILGQLDGLAGRRGDSHAPRGTRREQVAGI